MCPDPVLTWFHAKSGRKNKNAISSDRQRHSDKRLRSNSSAIIAGLSSAEAVLSLSQPAVQQSDSKAAEKRVTTIETAGEK